MNKRQEQEFTERLDGLERAIQRLTGTIERLDERIAGSVVQASGGVSEAQLKPARETAPTAEQIHAAEPTPAGSLPGVSTGWKKDLFEPKRAAAVHRERVSSSATGAIPTTEAAQKKSLWDKPPKLPQSLKHSRNWLNMIGVLLLLLGVVFLFKYTADQGWLVPPIRIGMGLGIGLALLAEGIFIYNKHRHFSQVFSGAGVAALYITGFGAYALYELVPYYVAFAFLGSVSLVALALSLGQRVETLSLIGVAGALATPLLLREGMDSLPGVIVYICMVLAVASLVYLYKGWRALLWVAVAGGWTAMMVFYAILPVRTEFATDERVALQAGIGFTLVAFWIVPVVREVLRERRPGRWGYRVPGLMERYLLADYERLAAVHVHLLAISTPLAALRLSMEVWDGHYHIIGWTTLGVAALYGVASLLLLSRSGKLRNLAFTQGLMSMVLVSIALVLLLDGDALFFSFVVQAALVEIVALRLRDEPAHFFAHLYFVVIGIWLMERLLRLEPTGAAMLNAQALPELTAITAAAGLSFFQNDWRIKLVYRMAAYLALLGLLYRELSVLDNGQGYVTVAWGVCAITLLMAGLVADNGFARIAGLVTLYVVVGKLLLVDLTEVAATWRILLFISFGILFLVLSYFYQSLWKHHKLGPPGAPRSSDHSAGPTMQV